MKNELTLQSTARMNDGHRIPMLGLGVFKMDEAAECVRAVRWAIDAGYRHIDTAFVYENEEYVGEAVAGCGVPREELFLTTKTPFDHDPARIREVFEQSLRKLRTDYVDLYLIHWPLKDEGLPGAWETLQQLKDEGRCRSIGVSNFTVARFEQAFLPEVSTVPAVNQIELHVFKQQTDLLDFCRSKDIVVEAYSPLARALKMDQPDLARIADEHGKSPAQVMIRWCLQEGAVVIPKSSHEARIRENADVFDFSLSESEMATLAGLDEGFDALEWRPRGFY